MFLWWIKPFCKPFLCTFSSFVFHLTAVLLLLTQCCKGQSQMIGSTRPLLALLGEDTILPCRLEPAIDVTIRTVEWARSDLNPRFVHLWRDGAEILLNQHPSYVGRTSLSADKLKQGDISLKLLKVELSDEGEYRCHVPEVATSTVQLAVGAVSCSIAIKAYADESSSRVVLHCESSGWYPEPEVFWSDDKESLLSAGPTDALRGPDGLFTVSSKLIVEKGDNNKFLCRVLQKTINQTRSTEIQIPEYVLVDRTCSAVRNIVVVVSSLGFVLTCAVLITLWKQRQRKMNKMQTESETKGTEENKQLVKCEKLHEEMAKLDEILKDKNTEREAFQHVLGILNEQKIEQANFRYEQQSQQEELEKEYMKNEAKLKTLEVKYQWDKGDKKSQLLEKKIELENRRTDYKKSLENNEEKLQRTEDKITKITGVKEKLDNQIKLIQQQLEETERQTGAEIQEGSV